MSFHGPQPLVVTFFILGAMIPVLIVVFIYVYSAFALKSIASKANVQKPWLAWVPLANVYLTAKLAGFPKWAGYSLMFLLLLFIASQFQYLNTVFGFAWAIINPPTPEFALTLDPIRPLANLFLVFHLAVLLVVSITILGPIGVMVSTAYVFPLLSNLTDLKEVASLGYDITGIILALTISTAAYLALLPAYVFMWWKIAESRRQPGWYSLLMLIPLINLILLGIVAWSKKKTVSLPHGN